MTGFIVSVPLCLQAFYDLSLLPPMLQQRARYGGYSILNVFRH